MKRYRTKKEYVYEYLKKQILSGILEPGQQVKNSEIANRLNVSENPVREAVQQLQTEGMVVVKPYVGTIVSILSEEDIEYIFELRILLETTAAKQAIKNIEEDDLKNLWQVVEEMGEAVRREKIFRFAELNQKFHMDIYKKSHNPYLIKMIEELWSLIFRYSLAVYSSKKIMDSLEDHRKILQTLEEKDSSRIEELISSHQKEAMVNFKETIKKRTLP